MKTKFILPLIGASLLANIANAETYEDLTQTEEELVERAVEQNNDFFLEHSNDPRKKDWNKLLQLRSKYNIVLSPSEDGEGFHLGLDCIGDVLDVDGQDKSVDRICNKELDDIERFRNYGKKGKRGELNNEHYTFRGLGTLPEPEPIKTEEPKEVKQEPKVEPEGKFTATFGPLLNQTPFTAEAFGFDGRLYGGKFSLTFQPTGTDFYFGGEVLGMGMVNEETKKTSVKAADGPLEDRLLGKGTADYNLGVVGVGLGAVAGHRSLFLDEKIFEVGLELNLGMLNYVIMKEITENSAHYLDGNKLEGSETNNSTSTTEIVPTFYGNLGVPLGIPHASLRLTPFGGLTGNEQGLGGFFGVTIGYSPQ